jgi:ABC-2 type transport system permease protein
VRATIAKDILIAGRYRPDLAARFADLSIRILFFWMFSRLISINAASSPLGHAITGRELMVYFQGALTLFVFTSTALSAPVNSVSRDLYNGTLEYLYSGPSPRYAYFVGTVLASAILSQVVFLPVFAILVAMSKPSLLDTVLMLAACGMVLATVIALGVILALLALLWRQVASIASALSIMFEMLSGAYVPVTGFPDGLYYVALVLPYTWGYDLIRYYSFDRRWETMFPVAIEWSVLAAFALIFTAISRVLLKSTERVAKRKGLHLL